MKNGTCWLDTEGRPIQAHGGCIIEYGGQYFWYGENKAVKTANGRVEFAGFSCYSSRDLHSWKNEGVVLPPVLNPRHELNTANVGERPKVLYNDRTGRFVMLFHLDNSAYSYARVGVGISDNPVGPFVYQGSIRPCGRDSRDMYVFRDDDGSAYLVCSSDWNSSTLICLLNDSYTGLAGSAKTTFIDQYREAQVLIKEQDTYYMFSSGCTGWAPNSMLYAVSISPMGIWKLIDNPCSGQNYRKTFYGQSANAFRWKGQWNIMLDHWLPADLGNSGYSFLPIRIDGEYVEIPWVEEW
ncbi:MAG: glycoside hydrolase family 43 protein [Treponema sp.]|jgi:hypothetical protein|nr:glycoside hydrolase family 43 protein [Treponema sp.]